MPDHPEYLAIRAIVRAEGAHAEPGGRDRWRMPTFVLRIHAPGRFFSLVGCRFDRPAETIARVLAARERGV